jgi:hypothetical protein
MRRRYGNYVSKASEPEKFLRHRTARDVRPPTNQPIIPFVSDAPTR